MDVVESGLWTFMTVIIEINYGVWGVPIREKFRERHYRKTSAYFGPEARGPLTSGSEISQRRAL